MKSKKRLTIEDRMVIQACLHDGRSIGQIASRLKVNKSTISRELRKFCVAKESYFPVCRKLKRMIVCNACKITRGCNHDKRFYNFVEAEKRSELLRRIPRSKTQIPPSTLKTIDAIVSEGVTLGQSLHHIFVSHPILSSFCCERTIRRLVYRGNLSVKAHQLRRYATFRHSYRKSPEESKLRDIRVLIGRTFRDFLEYTTCHKRPNVVQYDSVIGQKDDKKALLTVTFPKFGFQFAFLINKDSPNHVRSLLSRLFDALGNDKVAKIFPVNLADNGVEFSYFSQIEDDPNGVKRCRTFFTTPYRATDKPECERNHVLIRYVLPKGKSLDFLTQDRVDDIFSNINSYVRQSKKDRPPYDLVRARFGKDFLDAIHIRRIPNKKVRLTQIA